jgi:hypothetical protein
MPNTIVSKVQSLLLTVSVGDKLTACLILACGVSLAARIIRSRKRVTANVDPVGSSFITDQRLWS